MQSQKPRIAIIGAGMSGMLMAIKLQKAGIENFTVYEKAGKVGGTWRENRYPGVACDVASFSYCYEFEPNPDWSRRFSPGPEIQQYFERVADKYDLHRYVRYNTTVTDAIFQDDQWHLTTDAGDKEVFDLVVAATGPLRERKYPDIEGLKDFAGHCFHTADWDDDLDLAGKRIGIIGTGSSGVQAVAPLAEKASHLTVFLRTAQWVIGTSNPEYSRFNRFLKRHIPLIGKITRKFYDWVGDQFGRAALYEGWRRRFIFWACRKNLESVKDPVLREKLRPKDLPMCRRMIMSDTYYPAVQQSHVDVVTETIERIEPEGVRTVDGRLHKLDVLVLATGFYPNAWGIRNVVGAEGQRLDETWQQGLRTYRTITLPGFPNYFMLIGPNTPITNLSLIDIADIGVEYILQCVEKIQAGEFTTMMPKEDVAEQFNKTLQSAFDGTVWVSGCNSWYLDADGIPATWPWVPADFRAALETPEWSHYELS